MKFKSSNWGPSIVTGEIYLIQKEKWCQFALYLVIYYVSFCEFWMKLDIFDGMSCAYMH